MKLNLRQMLALSIIVFALGFHLFSTAFGFDMATQIFFGAMGILGIAAGLVGFTYWALNKLEEGGDKNEKK